jgi:hypothetical protein
MPRAKTRRDLLYAIADRIGGERGKRMRELIRHSDFPAMLDRALPAEEFARQLENAERDLPSILANLEKLGPADPGTWGFPN